MPELPPEAFLKQDGGDAAAFYAPTRLVTHIDEPATRALTDFYRAVLPTGGVLLHLMSSWVSHLPPEIAFGEVIGQGMNADELQVNPRLSRSYGERLHRFTPQRVLSVHRAAAAARAWSAKRLVRIRTA